MILGELEEKRSPSIGIENSPKYLGDPGIEILGGNCCPGLWFRQCAPFRQSLGICSGAFVHCKKLEKFQLFAMQLSVAGCGRFAA